MSDRSMLDKAGRLTSGTKDLHIRRKHLTNILRDATHSVRTCMANWPAEFDLPEDHSIHELLDVIEYVCDEMENP